MTPVLERRMGADTDLRPTSFRTIVLAADRRIRTACGCGLNFHLRDARLFAGSGLGRAGWDLRDTLTVE